MSESKRDFRIRWLDTIAMLCLCATTVGVLAWFFYSIPA